MSSLRFAYITDSHIGCDTTGYFLQPRYLGADKALFQALSQWIKAHDVSFVIHGGDITDHGLPDEIQQSRDLCELLGVPIHLCLGNHDLAQANSFQNWMAGDGSVLQGKGDCYALDVGPVRIVVVHHHWHEDTDHRWQHNRPQTPRLDAKQETTRARLIAETSKPVIAITHAPLNDVASSQRGDDKPFHPPYEPYLASWQRLADANANLRLIFTGHNHATSMRDHGSFVSCTTAALSETPAQVRLVTIDDESIQVETHTLDSMMPSPLPPGEKHAWCVGSQAAQQFQVPTDAH